MGVRTITTDNGCEFCAHEDISKMLGNVPIFFADSYASWQKGVIENENKLMRQYIPKGTDFDNVTPLFIKKYRQNSTTGAGLSSISLRLKSNSSNISLNFALAR